MTTKYFGLGLWQRLGTKWCHMGQVQYYPGHGVKPNTRQSLHGTPGWTTWPRKVHFHRARWMLCSMGSEIKIKENMSYKEDCPECIGDGYYDSPDCLYCNGYVSKEVLVKLSSEERKQLITLPNTKRSYS